MIILVVSSKTIMEAVRGKEEGVGDSFLLFLVKIIREVGSGNEYRVGASF